MGKKVKKKRRFLLIKVLINFAAISILLGALALYVSYQYFSKDLPDFRVIREYQPALVTEVYSSDGTLIAEFYSERRKLIEYEHIPDHVRNAFIAIEDKRFFTHKGFDPKRIVAVFLQNLKEGEIVGGASTITQQVVKNLIFSPERKYSRKIKEAILSYRMEKNLSKTEILFIYLNHIFFGENCYGIEAASKNYFGKSSTDLNIAEAAMLAAIPKAPRHYSPRLNFKRAKSRQEIILREMLRDGFITKAERDKAKNYKIKLAPKKNINAEVAPYFTEAIRQHLENKFGTRAFLNGGFKVFTTLDIDLSLAAQWALRRRILELEARHGREIVKDWLSSAKSIKAFLNRQKTGSLEVGRSYDGVVLKVEPATDNSGNKKQKNNRKTKQYLYTVTVGVGDQTAKLKIALSSPLGSPVPGLNNHFSKKFAPANGYKGWSLQSFIPKRGDVISVNIRSKSEDSFIAEPGFLPQTQGAVIAMDLSGHIIAMVGGLDYKKSQFNRAVQAKRQPGSSFKPIYYAAALDKGYTETTIVYDIPVVIDEWIPRNYDDNLLGAITLRKALAKSRNLASIRVIMDIDPEYAVTYAKKFNFTSLLNPFPSLALGGSEVTLIEMVTAYNVFATGGNVVEPKMTIRIYDRDNKLIEDNDTGELISQKEAEKAERERKRQVILNQIATEKGIKLKSKDEILIETDLSFATLNLTAKYMSKKMPLYLTPDEYIALLKSNPKHEMGKDPGTPAINSETAYIITDMLKAVVNEGTARRARILNSLAPIVGKTGTTNDFTDAWFIGYSPSIISGVWIGRDNHTSIGKKEPGSKAALPVWIDFMKEALKQYQKGDFKVPDGIQFINTPFGFIPYKTGSMFNEEDIKYLESHYYSPSGSEIDFLIRR